MVSIFEQAGTVSVTSGSRTVTGTGTTWLSAYDGIALNIRGASYPVESIDSQTTLTLVKPYPAATQTGQEYTFLPLQPNNYQLAKKVNDNLALATRIMEGMGAQTAADTNAVGGRAAASVLADIDLNADTMLEQTLRVDTLQQQIASRTLIGTKPINAVVTEHYKEFTDANSASSAKLNLIGSVSADGLNLVLSPTTVKAGDGRLLSTILSTLEADSDRHEASIANLETLLIDPTGETSRRVLKANASGYITGTYATDKGLEGPFVVLDTEFKVVNATGGVPTTVFRYENGEVTIPNAPVGKIKPYAVDTDAIGLTAINKTATTEASSNITAPYNRSTKQLLSVATVKDVGESAVEVEFSFRVALGKYAGYFTIERTSPSGTVQMDRFDYHAPLLSNLNGYNSYRVPLYYKRRFTGVAAGAQTWRVNLTHLADDDGGTGGYLEAGTNIFVTEVKR